MFNSLTPVLLCLVFLFPTLVLGLLAPSPSSSPSSNITIGSYISASPNNGTNYWPSPSGNFAFGFHPKSNEIGIWINKSPAKTLVWTTKVEERGHPIDNSSSIQLNNDGVFVLRRSGITPTPLFDKVWVLASYATMNDNGNFIIYNDKSDIIWQSFDYPTDTLLPGQTLTLDKRLVTANFSYCLKFFEGNYFGIEQRHDDKNKFWIWTTRHLKEEKGKSVALNLNSTGGLSLVNKDGLITSNIVQGEGQVEGDTTYRATLGSDGVLRVYGERTNGDIVELWHSFCSQCLEDFKQQFWEFLSFGVVLLLFGTLQQSCGLEAKSCYDCFLLVAPWLGGCGFIIAALVMHFAYIRPFHP